MNARHFSFVVIILIVVSIVHSAPKARQEQPDLGLGPCNSMLRLSRCRTLMVDYKLVRDDFPALRSLSDEEINKVLSDDLCVISEGQLAGVARKLITKPSLETNDSRVVEGYRQTNEGRGAIVYSELMEGWVNVKGTGAINPYQEQHKHGSLILNLALGEFFKAKMVDKVLSHSRGEYLSKKVKEKSGKWFPELRAVPYYAVIAYDHYGLFPSENADSIEREAVGLIVRQVHKKTPSYIARPIQIVQIESILRPYGWTAISTESNRSSPGYPAYQANYWINTQLSVDNQLVDFSHFSLFPSFNKPSYSMLALFASGCRTLHGYPRWTEECITSAASQTVELGLNYTYSQPYPEISFYHLFPNETGPNAHTYDYLHRYGIEEMVTSFIPDLQLPVKLNDPTILPIMQRVLNIMNNKVDKIFRRNPVNPGLVAAEKRLHGWKITNGQNALLFFLCSHYSQDKKVTQKLSNTTVASLKNSIEMKTIHDEL